MTVSVVTGAGSGIGRGCATVLARRGDHVVCADVDGTAAAETAAALASAHAVQVDVRDSAGCDRMVATAVERFGTVDVMVCAAGIERAAPAHELSDDDFLATMAVNVNGVFYSARAAARAMIGRRDDDGRRGGRIVLIGSINSRIALRGQAAYCASKGAVLMLGNALAVDWADHGITVNTIGPGVVDTPMSARSLGDPERRAMLMNNIPLGRPADAEEIAHAVAFLASPQASYITGAYLPVDGGWLAG